MNSHPNANANAVTVNIPLRITLSFGGASGGVAPVSLIGGMTAPVSGLTTEAIANFSVGSIAARNFTWRTALSLAMASDLAYSPRDVVERTALNWGLNTCAFVEALDTQSFVAATNDVALIAFRGTESIRDWITDLNARRVTRPYGLVHRGFYHAFNDVRTRLERVLESFPERKIVLTGHSLGGALATVAAAE